MIFLLIVYEIFWVLNCLTTIWPHLSYAESATVLLIETITN